MIFSLLQLNRLVHRLSSGRAGSKCPIMARSTEDCDEGRLQLLIKNVTAENYGVRWGHRAFSIIAVKRLASCSYRNIDKINWGHSGGERRFATGPVSTFAHGSAQLVSGLLSKAHTTRHDDAHREDSRSRITVAVRMTSCKAHVSN